MVIAVSRHPAALREDCLRADILISQLELRLPFRKPSLILDRARSLKQRTIAIFMNADESLIITSVTGALGRGPWSRTVR